MSTYSLPTREVLECIKQYIKSGETVEISDLLENNSILYREVIFFKKWSKNNSKVPLGYLYINEKNEIISQKTLKERLAKLAYFLEIFYNTENKSCIVNTFEDETKVKKDNDNYRLMTEGLEILTKDGNMDSQQVKQMVLKLPGIREESNEILKSFMAKAKEYRDEKKYFDINMLEKLLLIYREALSINLKKIRLVYSAKECYENINKISKKKRKQIFTRFNYKLNKSLTKTSYMMDFFIKVVNSCETISRKTDLQYFKYLETIEKTNIDNRVKLNRSKKN
ncbi:hypothetical protein LL033_20920 [Clostridium estertheticum]|uniref:hypothetical protein n=1 Tax=Clostridium estertheticum TaxID=238834 RepID=UPI001C0D69DB|nr:hypothetical protein [Clostridium estertheticum]MBU3217126.1 hypothetical protein [Clostridium estertheticum]WAG55039.1 hypothetical protein LL033_20920 [Clostridium estertheticum]